MFSNPLAVKDCLLHRFPEQTIWVIGDLMLDKYLWGSCNRISPEAPVPVVRLQKKTHSLGGAANVACNLSTLNVYTELMGFVGHDDDAELLKRECQSRSIGTEGVLSIAEFCTITKTRILAEDRQLIRLDEEITYPRSKNDSDALLESIRKKLAQSKPSGVIVSDYAKGVCTPYFCQELINLCKSHSIPVFVDPKGKDYQKYAGATAIKPNRSEMVEVASALGWSTDDVVKCAANLREMLDLQFVALTLGAHGIAVVEKESVHQIPTVAKEVYDVSGAGDTVIASMVSGLAAGLSLHDSVALANLAAAEVIAKVGSTPVSREDLLVAIQAQSRSTSLRKAYSLSELETLTKAWKSRGLKIAFTNGCFDILHAGHVQLLESAAMKADRLIVAINSDESTARLKGPGRPLMRVEQRIAILSALESVDAVMVYDENTPVDAIRSLQPDFLVKGGDLRLDQVVGAEVVESYGGTVVLIPLVENVNNDNLAQLIGGTQEGSQKK